MAALQLLEELLLLFENSDLIKDIDDHKHLPNDDDEMHSTASQNLAIPDTKHSNKNDIQQALIQNVSSSSCRQILSLFHNHSIFDDGLINKFKQEIAKYIQHYNVDGGTLLSMQRKTFGQSIVDYYNNKNLRGAANRTHDKFAKINDHNATGIDSIEHQLHTSQHHSVIQESDEGDIKQDTQENERYEGMKNELHELGDKKDKLTTPLTIDSSSDVTLSDSIIQHLFTKTPNKNRYRNW